jgi:hypothetical protein
MEPGSSLQQSLRKRAGSNCQNFTRSSASSTIILILLQPFRLASLLCLKPQKMTRIPNPVEVSILLVMLMTNKQAVAAGVRNPNEVAARHVISAFEQALQFRLHQIVHGYSLEHDRVGQYVDKILDAIQQIRCGSRVESGLIFPLAMAGASCDTEDQRLIIRDRFLVLERTLGFCYVYVKGLETAWGRGQLGFYSMFRDS